MTTYGSRGNLVSTTPGTEDDSFALTADNAVPYLQSRGIRLFDASAEVLSGGVSGAVIGIDGPRPLVVKQALPTLLVEAHWEATTERAITEARAIEIMRAITPGNVPELVDCDERNFTLTMSRAPGTWTTWKEVLLAGATPNDIERARQIGRILGEWHSATWHDKKVADQFSNDLAFEQLRVDPFHREILRQRPHLAAPLNVLIEEITTLSECLVHGDFSPKNILVGDHDIWILDFEVSRYGASVFDVAFLLSHLFLKAVHVPDSAHILKIAGNAFLAAYEASNTAAPDLTNLGWHVAALLLARVEGKSPAGYLSSDERSLVRRLALDLLVENHPTVEHAWSRTLAATQR